MMASSSKFAATDAATSTSGSLPEAAAVEKLIQIGMYVSGMFRNGF
jgi:hypothetical protein